jgi:hypothetical protein
LNEEKKKRTFESKIKSISLDEFTKLLRFISPVEFTLEKEMYLGLRNA